MVMREVLIIVNSMLASQRNVHNLEGRNQSANVKERDVVVTDESVMIFLCQPVI
jgi:hypothetical protein